METSDGRLRVVARLARTRLYMESKSVGRAYHTGARNWWRRRPLPAPPPTSSAPRGWSSTTAGARTSASKNSDSAPHANATTAGAGVLGEPEACANGPTFGPCGERTGTGGRCGAGTGARRDSIAGRGGNARGSMTRNAPRVREYGAFRAIDQSGDTSSCEKCERPSGDSESTVRRHPTYAESRTTRLDVSWERQTPY